MSEYNFFLHHTKKIIEWSLLLFSNCLSNSTELWDLVSFFSSLENDVGSSSNDVWIKIVLYIRLTKWSNKRD